MKFTDAARFNILLIGVFLSLIISIVSLWESKRTDIIPVVTDENTMWENLDNHAEENWQRYTEPQGKTIEDISEVVQEFSAPSGDNTSYHVGIRSSDPYTNVYRYQNFTFSNAKNWEYRVRFKYSYVGYGPQALEFPFSVYTGTHRLEMGLQWIGPIELNNPRWRVWGGPKGGYWNENRPNGKSYDFKQNLTPNVWHTFKMVGNIKNDNIYYDYFEVDGEKFTVNETYPGIPEPSAARTTAAFQLDNNQFGSEQHVYLDDFALIGSDGK